MAFLGSIQAIHDKAAFRDAILPLTESPHGAVQVSAEGKLELVEFIPPAPTQRQASAELDEPTPSDE